MESDNLIKLYAWESDYGLISMNIDCIQTILYAKIANAPIDVISKCNPYASLSIDYPILSFNKKVLYKVEDIFNYFRRENYGADYMLTKKECSLSHAYVHMIVRNLKPVLEFVLWGNNRNYEELTRVWYSRAMYLPFNYIYVGRCHKRALNMMTVLYPCDNDNLDVIENHLIRQTSDTLNIVSNHIGSNEYFFGTFPSSIDALLYSYLAPLIKIPFPSQEIPNIVKSYPNLVRYVNRIDQKFFNALSKDVKYLKKEEEYKKMSNENEFHTSLKTKIFTFTFVFVAMFGYAASNNIIDMYKVRQFFTG